MKWVSKILAIISGIVLAIISYHFISGWITLIPWAMIAILTGYLSLTKKDAIINGILFGYFLFLTYILIGYDGKMDSNGIRRIILFSIAFSLVGGAAGFIGSAIGYMVKKKMKR